MENLDFGGLQNTKSNITFAKIVSAPKPFLWSQAYNAGKLFAVLSLEKEITDSENPDSISILGKDLLGKLEEEFFTLDFKDLKSIKQAISNTFKGIDSSIKYAFAASFLSNKTLHIFTVGQGSVFIIRDSKIAKFSANLNEDPKSITAFSGSLKNNDLIIISTNSSLNADQSSINGITPNDIAESLSPEILEKEDGKTSLIIAKYQEANIPKSDPSILLKKQEAQRDKSKERKNSLAFIRNFKKHNPFQNIKLNHSKKVILTLAVIVLIIFVSSVYFGIQKQQISKTRALFTASYPKAEKKYNEGNSLLDLNRNTAHQNFLDAKKILDGAKSKFSKNSKEEKQILELLGKTEKAIDISSGINQVTAKQVNLVSSAFLSLKKNISKESQFTQDENNIYYSDDSSVYKIEKGKEKQNAIVKNDGFWEKPTALGVYLGNIYVLDKSKNSILKFVPTESGYSQGNYITGDVKPDFSKAVSMTIDGSVFVLLKDGLIQKFTRGKPDQFTVSALDKPFSSPSKIFTDKNTSNMYILDNGNSRIVVLNKEGAYQNQYAASILKTAQDFDVKESNPSTNSGQGKKIFVLSQNKIYEIETK